MNTAVAHYAIIRFLPYAETGEFVNAGVLLWRPAPFYFDFRLDRRNARVAALFPHLDRRVYLQALRGLKTELQRLGALMAQLPVTQATALFAELVRPREALVRFAEPRTLLAGDLAATLDEQFGFYVEHDFATHEYQQKLLEKTVRAVLLEANLQRRFQPQDVGNADFHLRLPLVNVKEAPRPLAIKPLFLGDAEPTRIYDKGMHWAGKLRLVREVGGFQGEVLFAVQPPLPQQGQALFRAFEAANEALLEADATVVKADDTGPVLAFARRA